MKKLLLLWALAVLIAGNHGYSFSLFPSKNNTETNATSVEITARVWNRTEALETTVEPSTEAPKETQEDLSKVNTNVVRHTLQRTPSNDLFAEINVDTPQPAIFGPNNPFPLGMNLNMPPPSMDLPMGPPVYPPFPWSSPSGYSYRLPPWAPMANNYPTPFYPYAPPPAWMNPPPTHFLPYQHVYDVNSEFYVPMWQRSRRHVYYPIPSLQAPSYVRHHSIYHPVHYDQYPTVEVQQYPTVAVQQYPTVEVQPVSEEPMETTPKRNRIHFLVPTTPPPVVEKTLPEVHKASSHHFPQNSEYPTDHSLRHGYHNPFFRRHHYYYY